MSSNHHAHILIRSWDKEALTRELLSQLGLSGAHNPDLIVSEGSFGIDEARAITARLETRPFNEKRVVIIDASDMTKEAQNALLKTLEEPGEGNYFFLVAPYEDILLPTLRSRLQKFQAVPVSTEDNIKTESITDAPVLFLELSPVQRLDFAKKFKDDGCQLGPFLDSLLSHLKESGATYETLGKIFALRRYADDTSSDSRLILEHMSLVLE